MDTIASWLHQSGVPEQAARDYVVQMFLGLTTTAAATPECSFESLAGRHATSGGINAQFLRYLTEHGFPERVSQGPDALLQRIKTASRNRLDPN
jgi:pyrroline-5-carboxylate reductase